MATTRAALIWFAGLAFLASCEVGSLFDTPRTKVITVTPTQVVESAAPTDTRRAWTLEISTASRDATQQWTAHRASSETWLALATSSGTAPDTLALTLDPAELF